MTTNLWFLDTSNKRYELNKLIEGLIQFENRFKLNTESMNY
jgi:hypothetical protein